MKIGEFIQKHMSEKQINQAELARRSGVPASTISSIINRNNDRVAIEMMLKLCEVLECDIEEYINELKKEQTRQMPSLFSKKYYALDDFGKGAVNAILDCEYERCTYVESEELNEAHLAIEVESNNTKPEKTYTGIAAAYGGDNRVNQVSEKHLREAADMIWEDEENED